MSGSSIKRGIRLRGVEKRLVGVAERGDRRRRASEHVPNRQSKGKRKKRVAREGGGFEEKRDNAGLVVGRGGQVR